MKNERQQQSQTEHAKQTSTTARIERALREACDFLREARHVNPYDSGALVVDPWTRRDTRL